MIPAHVWTIIYIVNYLAAILCILHILNARRDPRGMMGWILTLLLLPIVGLICFLLIGRMPIERKVRRRHRRRRIIAPALARRKESLARSHDGLVATGLDGRQRDLMKVAMRVSGRLVTSGNDVTIYHEAERVFLALSLAVESAQSHVHLEYYIFTEDETGKAIGELLIKKAQQGVEVRLLLDAVGCWWLSRSFVRRLREGGVKVAFFLPWGPTGRRVHLNCRNHRKLVVTDGRVGFLGSQNIGDVYLGRRKKYGPWRDTHLRVEGPCVAQLQEVFVEDWHFAAHENLSDEERYFPAPIIAKDRLVQIVASGPDEKPDVLDQLLLAALSDARQEVSILTPYFVPDRAMLLVLKSAAYRGVRVRLLIPSRNNHWLALWAGRSNYEDLLESGVEVHEYAQALLHSKVVVVDRRWAMVGSANMDERSFRINFELTSVLYDSGLAQDLHADFDGLLVDARRVTHEEIAGWNYGQRLSAGLARLTSPLI